MTPKEHQELLKNQIFNSYNTEPIQKSTQEEEIGKTKDVEAEKAGDVIVKAGEGSKGGKIIGHTRRGKPIYDTFEHKAHKKFIKNEHGEAAGIHMSLSRNLMHEADNPKFNREECLKLMKHHDEQFDKHLAASR